MSYAKKVISVGAVISVLLAGSVLLSGELGWSAQQASKAAPTLEAPITEKELIKLVKHNKKHLDTLAPTIEARGVDFELTPDIEKSVRKAGADDAFIANLKNFTPSARAAQAKGPHITEAEAQAYNQLKSETDFDKLIQEADAYARNYPKSPLLTYVYSMEANAYQQKNDAANVVKYGEMSLELKPDNLMSLLLVSSILPQPQMLNVADAEKGKRLNLAENYAKKALQEINQLPKLPNETDQAYQQRKDLVVSGAYSSLGMVHLERSGMAIQPPDLVELGKAEQNYKTAIEKSNDPNPADYYRLGEIYSQEGKLDEAIAAFSNAGKLAPGTVIDQMADRQVKALKQRKAQAKTPAKP